jgi:hypothetical protein
MTLTPQDISAIEAVLGSAQALDHNSWFWNLRDASGRVLALTLSMVDNGTPAPSLVVSAQTHQGYLELHDVTAYLCIEPDEVMFIAKQADRFSSLVVGKTSTCSQFSNIRASLMKADLTELDPTLLMAAMQLSLAESLLETL